MLYILECMFEVIVAMGGGTGKPMKTTGEHIKFVWDGIIGIIGWIVLCAIIVGIIFLIKHFKK